MNLPARPDNPFVRLINHRVSDTHSRREDYLTECFAWVVGGDEALQEAFLGPGGLFLGERPDLAPASMTGFSITTQVQATATDRPDIEIRVGGVHLYIECKVDAGYDPAQIARYLHLVQGEPGGALAAIVRRAARPSDAGSTDPSFLGIFDWEQVYATIEGVEETSPATQPYRGWLLGLLAEWGLRPAAPSLSDGARLAEIFDTARREVEVDLRRKDRAQEVPALYRSNEGSPRLVPYKAYSGKGAPPRPVYQFSVCLVPRFARRLEYPFGAFVLTVSFLPRAELREHEPGISLEVQLAPILDREPRTRKVQGLEGGELAAQILERAGVATVSEEGRRALAARAGARRDDFKVRVEGVFADVVARLRRGPIPAGDPRPVTSGGWVRVSLAPLEALVPPDASPEEIQERYGAWLRAVVSALCAARFDEPLVRFVADAVLLTGRDPGPT
jgi:hypothetical protein